VNAVTLDPSSASTVYAGASIALNTTVPAVQSLVFSPSNAIFAGTSSGVFKSTDAGVNWGSASQLPVCP
jgi:hypothetical protein